MDLLDFVDRERLLSFFHHHKTEMSSMDNPHTFLRKLRDHNLIPEDRYQKMSRMKKNNLERGFYDFLDWLERETPERITEFWKCAFKEAFRQQYPTLQQLYNDLMEDIRCIPYTPIPSMDVNAITGSYVNVPLLEKVEKEKTEAGTLPEKKGDGGEKKEHAEKKKGKRSMCNDDNSENKQERASTSSSSTPGQRKKAKTASNSPFLKGESTKPQLPVSSGHPEGTLNTSKLPKDIQPGSASKSMDTNAKRKGKEKLDEKKSKGPPQKDTVVAKKVKSEQPSTSSSLTPGQGKKSQKMSDSLFTKGEKSGVKIPAYLPVTCGQKKGRLYRHKLAKGEKCIKVGEDWFTPPEFHRFAGKESSKKWKTSIQWKGITLARLIKNGQLKVGQFKRKSTKGAESLSPPIYVLSDEEEESVEEEQAKKQAKKQTKKQAEKQPEGRHDPTNKMLQVRCGDKTGTLHTKRFASGVCGKCIRTETSWLTPEQFLREASLPSGASWKKDIKWDQIPLGVLVEAKTLRIHSLLCDCSLCKLESTDLEKKKNTDECFICKSRGEEVVACDDCPHSYHLKCHLPHVDGAMLGGSGPWMCTLCVFRDNPSCYYPENCTRKTAMSAQISQHLLRCQYLLLCLSGADQEQTFAFNPGLYLEDYSTVIETPMWLRKIAEKLHLQQYQTVGQFVSDIQLIFSNWTKYNQDNAESCARAKKLKNLFDREFKKVFNIKTKSVLSSIC